MHTKANKTNQQCGSRLARQIDLGIKLHKIRQSQKTQHQTLFTKKCKSTKHINIMLHIPFEV